MFLEPLWISVDRNETPRWLSDLKGLRLAVGAEGSGAKVFITQLLEANMVTAKNSALHTVGGSEALEALRNHSVDVALFVASPLLPAASLVAREGIHPTLVDLLLLAATDIHRRGDLFSERGEFPSDKHLDFPLNDEARRYLTSGPPLLQRHLPFWLATFAERTAVMLIPLITLLIPLTRILPPMLDWRTRRRIYQWYDELSAVDAALATTHSPEELDALRRRLDRIENELIRLTVPRHRTDLVFNLRGHVKLVRDRLPS